MEERSLNWFYNKDVWGNKLDIELEGKLGLPNKKGGGEGKYHMD